LNTIALSPPTYSSPHPFIVVNIKYIQTTRTPVSVTNNNNNLDIHHVTYVVHMLAGLTLTWTYMLSRLGRFTNTYFFSIITRNGDVSQPVNQRCLTCIHYFWQNRSKSFHRRDVLDVSNDSTVRPVKYMEERWCGLTITHCASCTS